MKTFLKTLRVFFKLKVKEISEFLFSFFQIVGIFSLAIAAIMVAAIGVGALVNYVINLIDPSFLEFWYTLTTISRPALLPHVSPVINDCMYIGMLSFIVMVFIAIIVMVCMSIVKFLRANWVKASVMVATQAKRG